ncbi:MAG: hypothetical protein WCF93_05610 [Candidatus Moraniibacteriota bacterium]
MKKDTKISVNGKLVTVLAEHDPRGTWVDTPSRIGEKVTLCTGAPVMVQTSIGPQIDTDLRQDALVELVSRTSDPKLVIVRAVPIPGTERREKSSLKTQ